MGVALPIIFWSHAEALNYRHCAPVPVFGYGTRTNERERVGPHGNVVNRVTPRRVSHGATDGQSCSRCHMVNPGPKDHHAPYCLGTTAWLLPQSGEEESITNVPLVNVDGRLAFACLCTTCAANAQARADGQSPQAESYVTDCLADLRQHMRQSSSTWLTEDVWKVRRLFSMVS